MPILEMQKKYIYMYTFGKKMYGKIFDRKQFLPNLDYIL